MRRPKSFLRMVFGPFGWGAVLIALFLASSLFVTVEALGKASRLGAKGESQMDTITAMVTAPGSRVGRRAWRSAVDTTWMPQHGQRHPVWIADHVPASSGIFGVWYWRAS